MTFITGPSLTAKSAPVVVNEKPHDHVIEMRVMNRPRTVYRIPAKALAPPLLMFGLATLIMIACLAGLLFLMPSLTVTTTTRYKGFCTIPVKDMSDEFYYEQPTYKVLPLRWASDPDVQALGALDEPGDGAGDGLREQFDIADTLEKISVVDNGRHVNFIHDFEANVTGIVDSDRCFLMDLDPEMVMTPEVLVLSIEGGAQFDVSRVRTTLRAALPALHHLAAAARALRERCATRPVYRLRSEGLQVRKRAVDAPGHDYVYFAGRRVHEIDISNLAELLQREQDAARL